MTGPGRKANERPISTRTVSQSPPVAVNDVDVLALLHLGPRSPDRIAAALGLSRSGTLRHLYALLRAGLVTRDASPAGRGRPGHVYALDRAARIEPPAPPPVRPPDAWRPSCMSDVELDRWDAAARQAHPIEDRPCVDCPVAWSRQQRALGLCNGVPGPGAGGSARRESARSGPNL